MRPVYRLMIISFISTILVLSALPNQCEAYPFKFQGYLKDDSGIPIPLATIYITGEIYDMETQDIAPMTWNTTTDAYGKYTIWIAANEPGGLFLNSTVTLSYNITDEVASTTVKVTGLSAWGNITYTEKTGLLDTLTSPLGIILTVILVSVFIFGIFLIRSGDGKEDLDEKPRKVERRRGRK